MSEEIKKTTIEAEIVEKPKSEHSKKHHENHSESEKHSEEASKTEESKKSEDFSFSKFTAILDKFFNKDVPSLPSDVKEILVKILPYLSIAGLVFYAIGILFILISLPILLITLQYGVILGSIISIGTCVLSAMAIPYLLKREKKGWTYTYYGFLIGLVGNLFSAGIIGFAIGGFIGGYFLFQLKSYYK